MSNPSYDRSKKKINKEKKKHNRAYFIRRAYQLCIISSSIWKISDLNLWIDCFNMRKCNNCTLKVERRCHSQSVVRNSGICAMAKSIHMALSPLLIINYVCGIRIMEFPAKCSRPWLGLLYSLLLWSVCFFLITRAMYTIPYDYVEYLISTWLKIFMTLSIVFFGVYHHMVSKKTLLRAIIR